MIGKTRRVNNVFLHLINNLFQNMFFSFLPRVFNPFFYNSLKVLPLVFKDGSLPRFQKSGCFESDKEQKKRLLLKIIVFKKISFFVNKTIGVKKK